MAALTDVLFPPRCPACGGEGWPLCADCVADVAVITPPWCRRCGRPTEVPVDRCRDCPPGPIDSVRAAFVYEGPVARAIKAMKFSGWHALAGHVGRAMAAASGRQADVVTWVPLSRRRRSRRGFDQAELLARAVARATGIPAARLLRRVRDTRAQARLAAADRRSALRGAFAAARPAPPHVLLVDDVVTTGSTAAACAAVLRSAGAGRVDVLAAARSLGGPIPDRSRAPPEERMEGRGARE